MTDPATPAPSPMTRRDFEAHIVASAWRDPKYKAALLAHPKGVVQNELAAIDPSIVLPPNLKVHVHEESADTYHLVVPRNPSEISLGEVIGDNLEAIAPQTVVIVVVGGAVLTIGAVVNAIGGGNVVAGGNVVTVGNAVANYNAIV